MVASHQDLSGISPNSILVLAMMIVMWSSVAVISGCQGSSGSCSCELCNNCSKAVKTLASVFSAACLIVCGPMGYGQRNWVPPNVTKMVLLKSSHSTVGCPYFEFSFWDRVDANLPRNAIPSSTWTSPTIVCLQQTAKSSLKL